MPDPDKITKHVPSPAMPEPTLFDSTSIEAGRKAARFAGVRYRAILQYLRDVGPGCIFEIAAYLSTPETPVFDHQISGRFSALEKANAILKTSDRRIKPGTGCECHVYQITLHGIGILADATKAGGGAGS